MAQSKKAHFLGPEIRAADYCKALSHPARIAVLNLLAERGTCTCGEVVAELPLAQSTVSQHLKVLVAVGLLTVEAEGPRSVYRVDADAVGDVRRSVQFMLARLQGAVAVRESPDADGLAPRS